MCLFIKYENCTNQWLLGWLLLLSWQPSVECQCRWRQQDHLKGSEYALWKSLNISTQHSSVSLKHEISYTRCNCVCVYSCLCTCNSVESSDHQHEDSRQVQVPPQTHLNEQGSRIQVSLVMETQHICQQCQQRFSVITDDVAQWRSGVLISLWRLTTAVRGQPGTFWFSLLRNDGPGTPASSRSEHTHFNINTLQLHRAGKHKKLRVHLGAQCDLTNWQLVTLYLHTFLKYLCTNKLFMFFVIKKQLCVCVVLTPCWGIFKAFHVFWHLNVPAEPALTSRQAYVCVCVCAN